MEDKRDSHHSSPQGGQRPQKPLRRQTEGSGLEDGKRQEKWEEGERD